MRLLEFNPVLQCVHSSLGNKRDKNNPYFLPRPIVYIQYFTSPKSTNSWCGLIVACMHTGHAYWTDKNRAQVDGKGAWYRSPFEYVLAKEIWLLNTIMYMKILTWIPGGPRGQMKWLKMYLLITKQLLPRYWSFNFPHLWLNFFLSLKRILKRDFFQEAKKKVDKVFVMHVPTLYFNFSNLCIKIIQIKT